MCVCECVSESRKHDCYSLNSVNVVIAVWSDWSEWSECSRSCEGGVTTRVRTCQGDSCTGVNQETSVCNEHISCTGEQ